MDIDSSDDVGFGDHNKPSPVGRAVTSAKFCFFMSTLSNWGFFCRWAYQMRMTCTFQYVRDSFMFTTFHALHLYIYLLSHSHS